MEFDLERAQELFDKGHFLRISEAASLDIGSLKRLQPTELRILVALTLVYTGGVQLAAELVDSLRGANASQAALAGAQIVLGLLKKRLGRIEESSSHFRVAARLAKDAGERRLLAWAHAHLFRLLADGNEEEQATGLLAEARRTSAEAGDAHVTAYLRDAVAAMETAKGRTVEAERHLRVVRSLIALRPNAWLEQLAALNASCIAIVNWDAEAFAKFSTQARVLAALTGHVNSDRAMEANDAYVALLNGQFDKADALLRKILAISASGRIELAAWESVARMNLVLGELEECERSLDRLETFKPQHLGFSYSFRTAASLRVKLLIRKLQFEAAAALAKSELSRMAAVKDTPSQTSLLILRALALSKSGRFEECSRELVDASLLGSAASRDHQAEYSHACGLILEGVNSPLAKSFISRSFRVWHAHGNQCSAIEAITGAGTKLIDRTATGRFIRDHSVIERPALAPNGHQAIAINYLAAAFDLAYNPRLLGQELVRAIRSCALSPAADLVTEAVSHNSPKTRTLHLGEHKGNHIQLECAIPDDPLKAILLGDVLRIGRAAVALERAREEERNRAALWPADPIADQGDAIFLAEEMQALLATVRRIAPTTVPVLITGETGTGKEVLARTIHACSTRAKNLFLPFNCASTPKDMLDSQLFGHRRGAFTGALEHFPGVIRTAAGGTLFLDEIGDTSLDVQPKLLRFLDSREVHGIGEAQPTRVDVRVIVATNVDVDRLVTEGRFREDLFYRLSIVRLHIPPLRERRVEIPSLANHYLRKHAQEYGKGNLRLSEDTMEYLVLYKWPGNVRQLASEMRRLAALAESDAVLMPEHLSRDIAASRRTIPPSERALDPTEVIVRLDQPIPAATQYLEQVMIQYALKTCGGRIEETAAMLGISRKGLYLKRLRFGIDPPGDTDVAAAAAGA